MLIVTGQNNTCFGDNVKCDTTPLISNLSAHYCLENCSINLSIMSENSCLSGAKSVFKSSHFVWARVQNPNVFNSHDIKNRKVAKKNQF